MYLLYSLVMAVGVLLLMPYWLVQGVRHRKYFSNLAQRLGFSLPEFPKTLGKDSGAIWIHAVSVGETLSGITLARRLKEKYPDRPLIVSTTTETGQALARERMPFADAVIYFPLDWAHCVRRMMENVRPGIVIVLETEIWPNFLREARRRNVPVIFVSGRISERSYERYQKALRAFGAVLRPFLRTALSDVAAFLMQSEADAERIRALGAPAEKVRVSGNLKYDLELPSATPVSTWLCEEIKRRNRFPVIVAGSVVASEEPLALIAFGVVQGDYPRALLVLAPRKPERFAAAGEYVEESRRKFVRRSEWKDGERAGAATNGAITDDVTVILLDSIGELASVYQVADGAFVGGSLVPSGGHNILEPAAFGKIPVFGPSMENFREMATRFVAGGAAIQVESPEDAGVAWIGLLRDPERQRRMGEAAKQLVDASRGATDRALEEIAAHLHGTR